MKTAKWSERYILSISEHLTIKEIMVLRDCGKPLATDIRNEALKYCATNNIEVFTQYVPTEAVLKVTNKPIDYYYDKMLLEAKALAY